MAARTPRAPPAAPPPRDERPRVRSRSPSPRSSLPCSSTPAKLSRPQKRRRRLQRAAAAAAAAGAASPAATLEPSLTEVTVKLDRILDLLRPAAAPPEQFWWNASAPPFEPWASQVEEYEKFEEHEKHAKYERRVHFRDEEHETREQHELEHVYEDLDWTSPAGAEQPEVEHERREQHELEHLFEDLDWRSPAGAGQHALERERRAQHELEHERRQQPEVEESGPPKVPTSTARWRRAVVKAFRLERGWRRVATLKEAFSEWVWFLEVARAGSDGEDAIVGYDTRAACGDTIEDECYTFASEFNQAFLAKRCGLARRSRPLARAFVCGECIGDLETQPGCCDSEPENSSPRKRKKKKKKQGHQKLKRKRKRDTAGPKKSEGIQEENITPLTSAA